MGVTTGHIENLAEEAKLSEKRHYEFEKRSMGLMLMEHLRKKIETKRRDRAFVNWLSWSKSLDILGRVLRFYRNRYVQSSWSMWCENITLIDLDKRKKRRGLSILDKMFVRADKTRLRVVFDTLVIKVSFSPNKRTLFLCILTTIQHFRASGPRVSPPPEDVLEASP